MKGVLKKLDSLNNKGFSTRRIAKRLRVGKSTVARWLNREDSPSERNFNKLKTFVKKVK